MSRKHKTARRRKAITGVIREDVIQLARKFFTYFTVFLFAIINCEYILFATEDYAHKKMLALAYVIVAVVLVVSELFKAKSIESAMCFMLAVMMIVDFFFMHTAYPGRDSFIRLMYYLVISVNFMSMGFDRLHEAIVLERLK